MDGSDKDYMDIVIIIMQHMYFFIYNKFYWSLLLPESITRQLSCDLCGSILFWNVRLHLHWPKLGKSKIAGLCQWSRDWLRQRRRIT